MCIYSHVVYVLSCFSRVQLFVTLWIVACQAPLSMGFSRQQYWSRLPCPPPWIFQTQELNPCLLCLLHWQAGSLLLTCIHVWVSSVQSLNRVWLFATPWTAAHPASLSITNSWSFLKLISIKSVMPSNYLILCHPLFLVLSIFPTFRVFSNESVGKYE